MRHPKRAARVITKVVINESGETGIYYDERGRPMLASALARDGRTSVTSALLAATPATSGSRLRCRRYPRARPRTMSASEKSSSGASTASLMKKPRPSAVTMERIAGSPRQQRAAIAADAQFVDVVASAHWSLLAGYLITVAL